MSWLHRVLGRDGASQLAVDPTYFAARVSLRPVEFGVLGCYAKSLNSGTIGAGLAAGASVYAFRYGGTNLAVLKKIVVAAANAGTGFTAGLGHLDLVPARSFTVAGSGGSAGTITGNNGKLKSAMGSLAGNYDIRIASTTALTNGTRTPDTDPIGSIEFPCSATANAVMIPPGTVLWEAKPGDTPFIMAASEGFEIQATVTATGTWGLSATSVWDEVTTANF
jgi:hypothetical protein